MLKYVVTFFSSIYTISHDKTQLFGNAATLLKKLSNGAGSLQIIRFELNLQEALIPKLTFVNIHYWEYNRKLT